MEIPETDCFGNPHPKVVYTKQMVYDWITCDFNESTHYLVVADTEEISRLHLKRYFDENHIENYDLLELEASYEIAPGILCTYEGV